MFWKNVWKWIFSSILQEGFLNGSIHLFWSSLALGSLWTFIWERHRKCIPLNLRTQVNPIFSFGFEFFFSFLNLCHQEINLRQKILPFHPHPQCLRNQRHHSLPQCWDSLFCFRFRIWDLQGLIGVNFRIFLRGLKCFGRRDKRLTGWLKNEWVEPNLQLRCCSSFVSELFLHFSWSQLTQFRNHPILWYEWADLHWCNFL